MQKTEYRIEYGCGWQFREGQGTPELVVRVRPGREWLRAEDGKPPTARTIIRYLPGGWDR